MKNQYIRIIVFISMFHLIFVANLFSQATVESNIPGSGAYLGWNDTWNANLDINQNNTLRKRFTSLGTYTGINGYSVSNANRMYLSENGNFQTPYSMLHMGSNMTTSFLQRPWMNVGVTMTSSQDLLHLGIIDVPVSSTNYHQIDAVLAWGCNPDSGIAGPDNFRFLFLQPTTVYPPTDAGTQQGRETMRITPMGNVGIGDFSHMPNGLNEQPTQRLDVDGTARLRQVPANDPHVLITGRKQDVNPTNGDYVLNYLEFSQDPNAVLNGVGDWVNVSGGLCDWTITGQNLSTGHAGSCLTGNVGVGRFASNTVRLDALVGVPNAIGSNSDICAVRGINNADGSVNNGILAVAAQLNQSETVGVNRGGYFIAANASEKGKNFGVYSVANDLNSWGYSRYSYGLLTYSARADTVFGVYARASQGRISNIGCVGIAEAPLSTCELNVGVYGSADGNNAGINNNIGTLGYAFRGNRNYGVYGQAPAGHWAGYFAGNVQTNGTIFMVSDEMFKTNIEEFSGGLDIINQLSPKTYNFIEDQISGMNFPSELQYGLIAQEIADVVPELVGVAVSPTIKDSLGNEISTTVEYNAVNYIGFIPILISAVKEQQLKIEEQDQSIAQLQESLNNQNEALAQMMDQLAAMQQQLNDCCNSGEGNRAMPSGVIQPQDFNNQKSVEGGNELFQNIPNPFRESTTISYSLEEGGRVQLSIYDNNGKVITTLTDANQGPGRYSEVWNANGMPSGVYHYALYVNGELLVKRAIKLQE